MLDDGTYYSRKVGDDKVTKHVVKDGKAVLSDAIYGHEYEFKGIKAPNNDYYVRKNISKEYANAGIPFVSADGNIDSKNVVIYGHSSKWDNIIFTPLMSYTDHNYYKKHDTFKFITEDETRMYQIFGVMNIDLNNLMIL